MKKDVKAALWRAARTAAQAAAGAGVAELSQIDDPTVRAIVAIFAAALGAFGMNLKAKPPLDDDESIV